MMDDLTYAQIDNIEKNLNVDWYKKSYLYKESIQRLMLDSLLNNRYLADQIEKSAMESRMAFNTVKQLEGKLEKIKGDVDFMLSMQTGVKRNKQSRKIRGIQIGTRTDRE
tara:strand:+ start:1196 stop:1525 length:330 start_codon:yes stop_codon:yes gene_type:complete